MGEVGEELPVPLFGGLGVPQPHEFYEKTSPRRLADTILLDFFSPPLAENVLRIILQVSV